MNNANARISKGNSNNLPALIDRKTAARQKQIKAAIGESSGPVIELPTGIEVKGTGSTGVGETKLLPEPKISPRRQAALDKLDRAAKGEINPTLDRNTGFEVGRFIADERGNVMIEPVGGSTVPAGKGGIDTHTLYPNGSNYQRLNPFGHPPKSTIPHGHGHLMGTGPGMRGQGSSIDVNGNVVPWNSADAHWNIK